MVLILKLYLFYEIIKIFYKWVMKKNINAEKNFKFQKTTHHDSRQVHRRTGADARRVLASLQVARDPADRELQARLGGSARRLLASLSFTSSGHRELFVFA